MVYFFPLLGVLFLSLPSFYCYKIEEESEFEFSVVLTLREFSLSTSH